MMDTTGLRLSLGFVLRHCMNITWTSVQSLWRQPLQASASRSPPVKQHYSTVQIALYLPRIGERSSLAQVRVVSSP